MTAPHELIGFREHLVARRECGEVLLFLRPLQTLDESVDATRYSIEVNYRTNAEETLDAFAKIALGYVSAGVKQKNYHVKHVYADKPPRIIVSSRNWDDGEWVVLVSWNMKEKCFVLSKGFFNKDRHTVSVQASHKCQGDSAADITKDVLNMLHSLKGVKDRQQEKLKPVPLKRGPKG